MYTQMKLIECFDIPREVWNVPLFQILDVYTNVAKPSRLKNANSDIFQSCKIACKRKADKQKRRVYDQCWVVFDKDDFPANDFNMAIDLAKRNGFNVAYSNQAFEYWFLLHFNPYRGRIHGNLYSVMLGKLLDMEYRKKEGFASDLYNYLLARQPQAIRNAEVILSEISAGIPAAEESSTTVHLLVSELNKYL